MLELLLHIALGGLCYRIRGGLGNETVRKLLGKPLGWEIPNGYIRGVWALYVTLMLPITLASPVVFALAFWGCSAGYFKQVAEYFNFPSGFDLTKQENRSWKNYALLSARGMWTLAPLAACFCLLYPHLLFGVLAGLSFVPCYLIGVWIGDRCKRQSHSQWGEWLYGAVIGGVL